MIPNKIPAFLNPGDTIAIAASARKIKEFEIQFCVEYLQKKGFHVIFAEDLFADFNQFAGSDQTRAKSWNVLFKNPDVKAILCARGGYGTSRMVDLLDWNTFQKDPKWIIGFSDVTVLLAQAASIGISAIHAPMAFNFEKANPDSLNYLVDLLSGKLNDLTNSKQVFDREGFAKGNLIGGNLSLLAHLIGSDGNFNYEDAILFIEDIDEYLYNLDRMWHQIIRANLLSKIKGLIIGGFTDLKDHAIPFGISLNEILMNKIPDNIPVAWNFPVSHTEQNFPLITNTLVELTVDSNGTKLSYKI